MKNLNFTKFLPRCWCPRFQQPRPVRRRLRSLLRRLRSSAARWRSQSGSWSSWWRSCGRCQRRRRWRCRQSSCRAPARDRARMMNWRHRAALYQHRLVTSNKNIREEENGLWTHQSNWNGAICQTRSRWRPGRPPTLTRGASCPLFSLRIMPPTDIMVLGTQQNQLHGKRLEVV